MKQFNITIAIAFVLIQLSMIISKANAQGETSPRIVLEKAAMYAATNQHEKLKSLILPIDEESEKEVEIFIEFLKQQKQIREFLISGKNKFKEEFHSTLSNSIFLMLRMLSPDYYEQAAIDGEIIITGKLAYIDYEYSALDGTFTTYKDKIAFKEKDNRWYLAFSKDIYNAPLDKVIIALKQYLPAAIKAIEESPDSGTLAERLTEYEVYLKK